MTYVDNPQIPYGRMKMCHMMADTLEELHAMADRLGLLRCWFQNHPRHPHYDLSLSKRQLAIQYGAQAVSSKEMLEKTKK